MFIILVWRKGDHSSVQIARNVGPNDEDLGPMLFETKAKAYKMALVLQEGWDFQIVELKGEIDWFCSLSSDEVRKLIGID